MRRFLPLLALLACSAPTDSGSSSKDSGSPVGATGVPTGLTTGTPAGTTTTPTTPTVTHPRDDQLTWVDVQARGTHNSYHIEPAVPVDASHRYTHEPLEVQLEDLGVRQFELDLHYRDGVGFEVFHLPVVDAESTCTTLVDCLWPVIQWSDAHPDHMPILIWFEPKDDVDFLIPSLVDIDGAAFDELDQQLIAGFGRDRIIAPDDIRGTHATLSEAVQADGWPTLGELRGKFAFSLLDSGGKRDIYLEGSDVLAGRMLFVDSNDENDPYAAMFKIDNAQSDQAEVQRLVQLGFLVTSNADSAADSEADNTAKRDATLAAGTHYLSSDIPADPGSGSYWLEIPDGVPARCNPLSTQPCDPVDIESLP